MEIILFLKLYNLVLKSRDRDVSYLFGYKTVFFPAKTTLNLDPSYKTDLDYWDCF